VHARDLEVCPVRGARQVLMVRRVPLDHAGLTVREDPKARPAHLPTTPTITIQVRC